MEPIGRPCLVFSVYHARLHCRQSFGLGCTRGKRRWPLDSGGDLPVGGGYGMHIMVAQTSSPAASRLASMPDLRLALLQGSAWALGRRLL